MKVSRDTIVKALQNERIRTLIDLGVREVIAHRNQRVKQLTGLVELAEELVKARSHEQRSAIAARMRAYQSANNL